MSRSASAAATGVSCEAIAALVCRALAEFGAPEGERRMFTLAVKAEEPGLVEAAQMISATLTALPLEALQREAARVLTPSPVVEARFGAPASQRPRRSRARAPAGNCSGRGSRPTARPAP